MKKKKREEERKTEAASALLNLCFIEQEQDPEDVVTEEDQHCNNEACARQIQSLNDECQALRTENLKLKEKLNDFDIAKETFRNNDEKVRNITGLPSFAKLIVVFTSILPFLKASSNLDPFKQFIMTLIRLKFNVPLVYLSFTFGISVPTASRLFNHTINVMHHFLVPTLVFWPNREELRKTLPMTFRNSAFQKCTCIIDCFEIFIERPGNLKARAQTYSQYKSHNTMKYLIGITPKGTVSFISMGWGGRTSDKFITEHSGFLNKLDSGDLVLADRGFDVAESIGLQQAELKIPAFTKGKKQLDAVEIEDTRRLASVRIHVERIIGTVRQRFTMLQGTIPISLLEFSGEEKITPLDKIVAVCCALSNVWPSIVPSD